MSRTDINRQSYKTVQIQPASIREGLLQNDRNVKKSNNLYDGLKQRLFRNALKIESMFCVHVT
jgi:hypothetical protein